MFMKILLLRREYDRNIFFALKGAGYQVKEAVSQKDLFEKAEAFSPNITIICPKGFSLTRKFFEKIKENIHLSMVPLVVISEACNLPMLISIVNGNADDYIVWPLGKEELQSRLERVKKKVSSILETNPLTKLPGNILIKSEIEKRIRSKRVFACAWIDIDKFKAYNDLYGFLRGDEVLHKTAELILEASESNCSGQKSFVGHIGGDDFIVIAQTDRIVRIARKVIRMFEALRTLFYSKKDLQRGFIIVKDRNGEVCRMPFMSISAAIVTNEKRKIYHPGQVSAIASELKSYLKDLSGSNYVKDRRGEFMATTKLKQETLYSV